MNGDHASPIPEPLIASTHVFWIVAVAFFGAIIGSFLNVVIYRMPRGLSISSPRWSFCPACRHRIRWYHNFPVFGWLFLRGRCFDCKASIESTYPIVECICAAMFLLIWDAIVLSSTLPGLTGWQTDWPLVIACFSLFAALLVVTVTDFEAYSLDIAPLIFAMIVGVLCHAVRGMPEAEWITSSVFVGAGMAEVREREVLGLLPPSLAMVGTVAGAAWCIFAFVVNSCSKRRLPEGGESPVDEEPPVSPARPFRPMPVILLTVAFVGLAAWMALEVVGVTSAGGAVRGGIGCAIFFAAIVIASMVQREADHQIVEEIESERHIARRMVLRELAGFLPGIAAGAVLLTLMIRANSLAAPFTNWSGPMDMPEAWVTHAEAALQAIGSMVLAAGLGWAVRILGTLAFGKEAFGAGDIYILAAIAAVLGFWAVFCAFFLAAILALIAYPIILLSKHSRAIPFGPWLSMAAFCLLWLYKPLLGHFGLPLRTIWSGMVGEPGSP